MRYLLNIILLLIFSFSFALGQKLEDRIITLDSIVYNCSITSMDEERIYFIMKFKYQRVSTSILRLNVKDFYWVKKAMGNRGIYPDQKIKKDRDTGKTDIPGRKARRTGALLLSTSLPVMVLGVLVLNADDSADLDEPGIGGAIIGVGFYQIPVGIVYLNCRSS